MTNGRLSNISPTQNCTKVYVQRDYSFGTMVRFQTQLPNELEDKIERSAFENTINHLNAYFLEAESASCKTYCQGCCACLTAYLMFLCVESHYEKSLKKIARFVTEQNEKVYIPRGLLIVNPAERGFRVLLWHTYGDFVECFLNVAIADRNYNTRSTDYLSSLITCTT